VFGILIYCKTALSNGAKLGGDDYWEEEIQICAE
jgi:hypothetical protein